jgi:hypothetical protein
VATNLAQFTHANNQQVLYVDLALVAAWWFSPAHKSTVLLMSGGAMAPILESPEEVSKKKAPPIVAQTPSNLHNESAHSNK